MEAIEERAPAQEPQLYTEAELDEASVDAEERGPVTISAVVGGDAPSGSPRVSDIDVLYPEWSFG